MGGEPIPYIKEIQVGPLPVSTTTTYSPLSWYYQNSTVPGVPGEGNFPFNARAAYDIEETALDGEYIRN